MVNELPFPDEDRGASLAATYIAGCAVSLVFVAMRLCARFSITGVGIDDWCMLLTWTIFLPLTILTSILSFNGWTRHLEYLAQDPKELQSAMRMNWITQPFAIFCLGTGKIAVAFLIIRLLNRASVWRRYSLYGASGLTLINTIIMIVLTFVQCEDPRALWNEKARETTTCWNPAVQSSFSIYGAAVHTAMDFFLALLPITLVYGLRTDMKKKIALCGLLGCGCITGVIAGIKTSKLMSLNARSDFTWETVPLLMWTGIEIILLMVCGSIPALKPIYSICLGRRQITLRSSQRTTAADKANTKRSYVRQVDSDLSFALGSVSHPTAAVVSRGSQDDEIALNGRGRYDKGDGGIQVTRTVEIQ